jgi:hypothetical protein
MNLRSARRPSVAIGLMLAALLTGCPRNPDRASHEAAAARMTDSVSAEAAVAHSADGGQYDKPAPPKGGPLPPQRILEPVQVERSCGADADCVIKDIGSCCGALPSCVNRDSPADPAAVKAECEKNGQDAHCIRQAPDKCACRQGQCVAAGKTPVGGWGDDTPSAPEPTH